MKSNNSTDEDAVYRRNSIILGTFLSSVLLAIGVLLSSAPKPTQPACSHVDGSFVKRAALPGFLGGADNKLDMVAELWLCAEAYREQNPGFMVTAFVSLYIALQSFAIPGTIILSILSGALYPLAQAQALVALCATIGSSTCYLLSFMFGRVIIKRKFPEAMASFKHKIDRNRDHLMFFMIFLRLTPLVPNAFVNMASSIVGIPFNIFFMGTMLGLLPANFIHAQTGRSLRNVTVQPEARWGQMAVLFGLQFVALLPVLIKKKLGRVIDAERVPEG